MDMKKSNPVTRPSHYTSGGLEVKTILKKKLTPEEFKGFCDRIDSDVYDFIAVDRCVERRNSIGGTSSASTDEQMLIAISELMGREDIVRQENELAERCWNALLE